MSGSNMQQRGIKRSRSTSLSRDSDGCNSTEPAFQRERIKRVHFTSSCASTSIADEPFIKLDPSVHNIERYQHHFSDLESLTCQLGMAVENGFSERHRRPYQRVAALLLSWEADDLGVNSEIVTLSSVLQNQYNFNVQKATIPSEELWEMPSKVDKFVQEYRLDSEDALFILYYGGHAQQDITRGVNPIWAA